MSVNSQKITTIDWIHPSVRDLVIEQLSNSSSAREAFLETVSIPGIKLAISDTGGAEGDRYLPLLQADSDWDILEKRCLFLISESTQPSSLREILLAFASALPEAQSEDIRLKLASTLRAIMEGLYRKLAGESIDLELLKAFSHCSTSFDPLFPLPSLKHTWEAAIANLSSESITGMFDGVRLIDFIQMHEPRFFRQVQFPANYEWIVEDVIQSVSSFTFGATDDLDDIDECSSRVDECDQLDSVVESLLQWFPTFKDELKEASASLDATRENIKEKKEELERSQPDDDDYYGYSRTKRPVPSNSKPFDLRPFSIKDYFEDL